MQGGRGAGELCCTGHRIRVVGLGAPPTPMRPGESPSTSPANISLRSVSTVRADHTSGRGPRRSRSWFIHTMWDAWGYSPPGEIQGRYYTPLTRPLSRSTTGTRSTGRLSEASTRVPYTAGFKGGGGGGKSGPRWRHPCSCAQQATLSRRTSAAARTPGSSKYGTQAVVEKSSSRGVGSRSRVFLGALYVPIRAGPADL